MVRTWGGAGKKKYIKNGLLRLSSQRRWWESRFSSRCTLSYTWLWDTLERGHRGHLLQVGRTNGLTNTVRPMERLPTHIDVPRLCKKITVTTDGDVVFDGKEDKYSDKNNAEVTKSLLGDLDLTIRTYHHRSCSRSSGRRRVAWPTQRHLWQNCSEWWDFSGKLLNDYKGGDVGSKLSAWFADTIQTVGNEPPTLLLFKTVHQQCIFPGFYCMRNILEPSVGFQ
jgi:hypothetical protein